MREFDLQILAYFYNLRTPLLTRVMLFITDLGGSILVLPALTMVCYLLIKNKYIESFLFGVSVGGGWILNMILKIVFQRMRPEFYPLVSESDYSFPSGHAMNSFIFYMTVAYIAYRLSAKKWPSALLTGCAVGIVMLIGISRIYLGVHFASDVVAGYVIGLVWVSGSIILFKLLFPLSKK